MEYYRVRFVNKTPETNIQYNSTTHNAIYIYKLQLTNFRRIYLQGGVSETTPAQPCENFP